MKSPGKLCARVIALGICGIVMVAYVVRLRQIRVAVAARSVPYGRYSERQIVERAAALCREIAPDAPLVQIQAEKAVLHSGKGGDTLSWSATCLDAQNQEVAYFLWNAETGSLQMASRLNGFPLTRGPILASREAEAQSWGWMRLLRIPAPGQRWYLDGEVQARPPVLITRWKCGSESIRVDIMARTGELIALRRSGPLAQANGITVSQR